MSKGGKIAWILGLLGIGTTVATVAIAASNQLEKLRQSDFELSDLKFLQIRPDLDSIIVSVNLKITNRSDIDIAVSKQFYEVFFNGNQVAKIVSKRRHVIKAGKVTKIPVIAQFPPKKIFKDIKSDIVNLVLNLNHALDKSKIQLNGHLYLSVIGIGIGKVPVGLEYTVKELRQPL